MMQSGTIQTVDPRYVGLLKLMFFLNKLDVIEIGQTKHTFSHGLTLMNSHQPKPYWIQMAIVSLALEYMEIHPIGKKYAKT
jgi:hypothetical protein